MICFNINAPFAQCWTNICNKYDNNYSKPTGPYLCRGCGWRALWGERIHHGFFFNNKHAVNGFYHNYLGLFLGESERSWGDIFQMSFVLKYIIINAK